MFLSNKIAGFFLHRDIYQRKIFFKSTAVGWLWSNMPSHAQACLNWSGGNFGWYGGDMVILKIVQNERLINF